MVSFSHMSLYLGRNTKQVIGS